MNGTRPPLQAVFDAAFADIGRARAAFTPRLVPREIGTILGVSTGIATVSGLQDAGFEEVLRFRGGVVGIAFNLDEDSIGTVLLGDHAALRAGDEVERTGRVTDVAVGDGLLGRVVDPLGRPLDGKGPVATTDRLPIERPAPAIMDRAPVTVPLATGIKVIDALIPIGRGQRELILGDRQTGKTTIALDTILNQRGKDVVCVYCALGQRASAVAKAIAVLADAGAMAFCVVVVAEGNDPPGLVYIAPYAATSIAEHFMEAGRDVLIVYDDLTQHARAYRELSLLLRRPPGREAYPGDVFYLHSRLLERASRVNADYVEAFTKGEVKGRTGSLTALPIIETQAGDVSAFVPTNVISITDGQIFLETSLFNAGIRPAINAGISVSRVGSSAQTKIIKGQSGGIRTDLAQYRELAAFAQFASDLDEATRKQLDRGARVTELLKQTQYSPQPISLMGATLFAVNKGFMDDVEVKKILAFEHGLHTHLKTSHAALLKKIDDTKALDKDSEAELTAAITAFKKSFA